jgi:hypothetical protein
VTLTQKEKRKKEENRKRKENNRNKRNKKRKVGQTHFVSAARPASCEINERPGTRDRCYDYFFGEKNLRFLF